MILSYHSNRMERLLDHLLEQLSTPLGSPLGRETIVVQNPGMARWLSQQLALRSGVAANLEFPLPASFTWNIYQAWLGEMPAESGFDRESLHWCIMGLLPGLLEQPAFAALQRYLEGDSGELRRYQLSGRIADLFDQYLVYRPQMVLAWENSAIETGTQDEPWQAALWRAIVAQTQGEHRAALFDRFQRMVARGDAPRGPLPERVSLFGLSTLAPLHLHALQALSQQTEVHLYLFNPCREYWADITDEKGLARRRARWRQSGKTDISALLDVGNPLLASMGQVGQGFIDQLLELEVIETELFEMPAETSLLGRLQQDILELADRRSADLVERTPLEQMDESIQLHACHSPLREVQVLHDRLRQMFDRLSGLEPRQVVVMAPNIATYAPYVQAVFGAAEGARHIPWSVADLSAEESSPLLQTLSSLLDLSSFRFAASQVVSLLEVPALARRFAIDDEGVERIRRWVRESGIRWGADAQMRGELGLPAESANSWDAGLERLFHGYALPPDAGLAQGVLPYPDIEGSDALDLGRLAALLERLRQWQARLSQPCDAPAWALRINALLADFFLPDSEEEALLQGVRHAMDSLTERCLASGFDEAIPIGVLRCELEQALAESLPGRRFLVGGVIFCNMVPMRSIPFRVVCLLGMNDSDYPRREVAPGFDLMAAAPRPGDRSRRLDDRYLFLEALLSARDCLYLSYVGRSVRDNSASPPSVVVSELMDYLEQSFRLETDAELLSQLLIEHPLQPFNRGYFDASDSRLFSYDAGWLAAADSRAQAVEKPFIDTQLPEPETAARQLELQDLVRFLINPSAWFLQHRLGVALAEEEAILEDTEPFDLNGLPAYLLRAEMLQQALQGEEPGELLPLAAARGELPHGEAGTAVFSRLSEEIRQIAERVRRRAEEVLEPQEVDLQLDGFHLTGWLEGVTPAGLLSYRPGKLKAKDRLRLWVNHLALCALRQQTAAEAPLSLHVAEDQTLILHSVEAPGQLLADLLQAWWQGQCAPLPFFAAASLSFAESGDLQRAIKVWEKDHDSGAPNWAVSTAFRGMQPLAEEAFSGLATRLGGPLLAASESIKAARDR